MIGHGQTASAATAAASALDDLLRGCPDAVVAALGPDGVVPVPPTIPLHGCAVFESFHGIDVFPTEGQLLVLDAWTRRDREPIIRVQTHVRSAPDRAVTWHLFDVREQHGVHVGVLEGADAELVRRSVERRGAPRRAAAHVTRDATAVFLSVDDATTDLLGWAGEALIGRRTIEIVHPDDAEQAVEAWLALRVVGGTSRQRVRYQHADGHYVWLEVTNRSDLDDPTAPVVRSDLVDITEEMAHLAALKEREHQLARLAEALPIGICHLHADGEAPYSNEPFRSILGPVSGHASLVHAVMSSDRGRVAMALDQAFAGAATEIEVGVPRGGEERRCELTFRPLDDHDPDDADRPTTVDSVIVCVSDVTDRSRLRAELEHQATHDALSGCLNRGATVAALERALRASPRVAVAFIDLDGFKAVNDGLGHAAGDELLRVVASRLRSVVRGEDQLGRIGGDEFVIICPEHAPSFDEEVLGERLIERLTAAISGEMTFATRRIAFRASIGVAISTAGELDAEALLTRADAAMYRTKRRAAVGAASVVL